MPPRPTREEHHFEPTEAPGPRGKVSVGDGFTGCAAAVPVKIQRRVSGDWKTVGTTTTTDTGAYKKRIKDRPGKYRSVSRKANLFTDFCLRAVSPVRRHS